MKQTSHAQAAKLIRKELKQQFPETKFSVRSESYSGGDSVNVSWVDGPTVEEVKKINSKYEKGHFDGMIDMYEYSNTRDDIPQVKFVLEHRDLSTETCKQLARVVIDNYADANGFIYPGDNELGRDFQFCGE